MVSAILLLVSLGQLIYDQWVSSSKVNLIASGIYISTPMLVCITTISLCFLAAPALCKFLYFIQELLFVIGNWKLSV